MFVQTVVQDSIRLSPEKLKTIRMKTGIRPNITKIVDREVKGQQKPTKQMGVDQSIP